MSDWVVLLIVMIPIALAGLLMIGERPEPPPRWPKGHGPSRYRELDRL